MKSKHLIRKYIKYLYKYGSKLNYIDENKPIYMLFGEDEFELDLKKKFLKLKGLGEFELDELEDNSDINVRRISYISFIMTDDGADISFHFDSNPYSIYSDLKDSDGQVKALPFYFDERYFY